MNDSIYALSTPPGNGVAVVRMSGPASERTLRRCFSRKGAYCSHRLYHGDIVDNESGIVLDDAMAVLMRAPQSYTGEDCAELHCHGSSAVLAQVLALLSKLGLRLAQPGEFTRRAFENGRLDLSQAEAVMDLIHASAEASAKSALEQLKGALASEVERLQDLLTDTIAELEAALDYPEEDWENDIQKNASTVVHAMIREIDVLISGGAQGRIIREGLRVALVGRPNVGKSTLLNALLGHDRAIVTELPGTTRDTIEESISIDGLMVRLCDTAGLRSSEDQVERIGVERAREAMRQADLILLLLDGSQDLTQEDQEILIEAGTFSKIGVITKGDLPTMLPVEEIEKVLQSPVVSIAIGQENWGLDILKKAVKSFFNALAPQEMPSLLVSNRRHIDALVMAKSALVEAESALEGNDMDCVCIDLRAVWHALGLISGRSADEVIVDRIFEKFCLGK